MAAPEACHLYPWCAFGPSRAPQVHAQEWKNVIFKDPRPNTPKGTETVQNLITFTATLHRFHTDGAFALRPVRLSDNKTEIELEFHWLPRISREPNSTVDIQEMPPSTRGHENSGDGYFAAKPDGSNMTTLRSGDRFKMTTDDVDRKPLPDFGLLELQWHMQRLMALSGAADWKDKDFQA